MVAVHLTNKMSESKMTNVTIRVYLNRKTQERHAVIDDKVYRFDISNPEWRAATDPDATFALKVYAERDILFHLPLAEFTLEELGQCTFVGIIPESLLNSGKTIEIQPIETKTH